MQCVRVCTLGHTSNTSNRFESISLIISYFKFVSLLYAIHIYCSPSLSIAFCILLYASLSQLKHRMPKNYLKDLKESAAFQVTHALMRRPYTVEWSSNKKQHISIVQFVLECWILFEKNTGKQVFIAWTRPLSTLWGQNIENASEWMSHWMVCVHEHEHENVNAYAPVTHLLCPIKTFVWLQWQWWDRALCI